MKAFKILLCVALVATLALMAAVRSQAASLGIIEVIKQAIVKVIKAVDLNIQRQQNKVIWLQNAQQAMQNTMSQTKLREIANWTQQQREQYQRYYDELKKVKNSIAQYQRIRMVAQKQARIVGEYQRVWQIVRADKNFTAEEVTEMAKVYGGILKESVENMRQVMTIIRSFSLTMTDGKRMELVDQAADRIDKNYDDLILYNRQNALLSIQRGESEQEIKSTRKLYGLGP